jgi:non-specific protein-tyrosine kinase
LELKRYILLLRRWWWLVSLITFLFGTFGFVNSFRTPATYEAKTTLLIDPAQNLTSSIDYTTLLVSQQLGKTYTELLRTPTLLDKVAKSLNLTISGERLSGLVKVQSLPNTQLLVLTVDDTDPQRAVLVANSIAEQFNIQNRDLQDNRYAAARQSLQDELQKIQTDITSTQATLDAVKTSTTPDQLAEQTRLQTQLSEYRNSYTTLFKSYQDIRLAEAQNTSNLSMAQPAQDAAKIGPNPPLATIQIGLLGLVLSVGIIFLIDYFDDSIKTTEQIEFLINSATLGIISRIKNGNLSSKLVTLTQPSSPTAEAYRVLRANIEFSEVDTRIRTLLITSSYPGEGKSTTAANLAIAIAQSGKKVILVDCDLRRPSLHKYFRQSNIRGVTTVLLEAGGSAIDHLVPIGIPNLRFMPSGLIPPNPSELMGSRRMLELVEELKSLCDIVIFDSSPILPVIDPTLLSRILDATLLVVSAGTTRVGALKKSCVQVSQSGTRVLGVVLNRVSAGNSSYYYYQYKYNYSGASRSKFKLPFFSRRQHKKRHSNGDASAVTHTFAIDDVTNDNLKLISTDSKNGSTKISLNGNGNGSSNGISPAYHADRKETAVLTSTTYSLDVMVGPDKGQHFDIKALRVVVGKAKNIDNPEKLFASPPNSNIKLLEDKFYLNDSQLNRRHIEIDFVGDDAYLTDLSSASGTWLNAVKIEDESVALHDSDEISLGPNTVLVFHKN